MTTTPTPRPPAPAAPPERESHVGLRVRLWAACVSGGVVAGVGMLWVLGTLPAPTTVAEGNLHASLAGVAFAAVLAGMVLAFWMDHHLVSHLRGLLRGMRTGRVVELRGLPSASGWGELSELTDVTQSLLGRQRQTAHAAEELEHVRTQIQALQAALEQWVRTEHWEAPAISGGALALASETLGRGLTRRAGVDEQNAQAARQVAAELAAALADAQESAEQAERGFVESTAMLTTVRELQRLSGELQGALVAMGAAPPEAATAAGESTREALEALVTASRESVDAIGRGMLRIQDVAALVQQLANRATLVAIHAVAGGPREEGPTGDLAAELKQLVVEVREATDRTTQLSMDVEGAVAEAGERMRVAREQALSRLEAAPAPAAPANVQARAFDDAQRLMDRVREMVQDAARKGERLSAAGERASRAAERLARRVSEESTEAQALVVRLGAEDPARPRGALHELHLLEDAETGGDAPAAVPEPDSREEERS